MLFRSNDTAYEMNLCDWSSDVCSSDLDHLANDDSRRKLKLGRKWASMAGRKYRYFMIFNHEKIDAEGAYTLDDIVGVLKEL